MDLRIKLILSSHITSQFHQPTCRGEPVYHITYIDIYLFEIKIHLAALLMRKAVMRMRALVVPKRILGNIRPGGEPTFGDHQDMIITTMAMM